MKHTLAALATALAIGALVCPDTAGAATNGGKACHVVGGPNTGKSGTYDDEGACAGDWGATECGGSNAGKCKDGAGKGKAQTGKSQNGKIQNVGATSKSGATKPTAPKPQGTATSSSSSKNKH
jgi:hypothetical protein